ncbi:DUF6565 domain-containing protein [Hymenobacter defluvii]|uniref:DUF6565 domain-containing protein n=1 Tax=Hymenobacter defluvii TaxID=2054411 RepID=A0ABS3T7R5_9BACT|nr:DUF6565 domain-containing protein [Hymenobacter defluvii]MBO3269263.1 hypothetical protein [Hymenobacter defluvii]
MLKRTFSTSALAASLLLGGLTFTQVSCTENQQKEVSQESDQAYNDFKSFVDETEMKAQNVANETEADYERETAQLKADYDTKVAVVDRYADSYDDQRKQELDQLRSRYTTASDARTTAWTSRPAVSADGSATVATDGTSVKMGKYYKPMTSEIAVMTPQNAQAKYNAFVNMVDSNKSSYDIDDWNNINADWRAMDARYDQIKDQISATDKRQIAEEKGKYAAFKSVDKTKIRAEQGANAVANTAEDVAHGAKETGKDIGQGAAKVGKDVGQGAKEVGKDIGQGAAKAGKAVGGAVKGVFNGKENE